MLDIDVPAAGLGWLDRTVTENRARKRAIRARMAATGEPYSVAARQVDRQQQLSDPGPKQESTPVDAPRP